MAIITQRNGTLEYLAAEHIPVPHGFTTRLGGVSQGACQGLNISFHRGDAPEAVDANPADTAEFFELKDTLARAIDRLPEKERTVVSLYYYEELTLKEISLILHLSEARISQLHTKAIFRMRNYLARMKETFY